MVSRPTNAGADIGRLLVTCPDRPGIVAAVSRFLFEHGANIMQSDQYSTDPEAGTFFLRMVFHLPGFDAGSEALQRDFHEAVAGAMGMTWQLRPSAWRSWSPARSTACWTCCGGRGAGSWTPTSGW
jgi:formyltetrahydrofolate hydrolase